uniref:Uncharacterized protein n=1 Tax=Glossina brevipalpis TaxID=37001 RepID=A0A1A9W1N6_9MUSC
MAKIFVGKDIAFFFIVKRISAPLWPIDKSPLHDNIFRIESQSYGTVAYGERSETFGIWNFGKALNFQSKQALKRNHEFAEESNASINSNVTNSINCVTICCITIVSDSIDSIGHKVVVAVFRANRICGVGSGGNSECRRVFVALFESVVVVVVVVVVLFATVLEDFRRINCPLALRNPQISIQSRVFMLTASDH